MDLAFFDLKVFAEAQLALLFPAAASGSAPRTVVIVACDKGLN